MAQQIISASGAQYGMVVESDGSINANTTAVSGAVVTDDGNRFIQRIDNIDMRATYLGFALPGTATSDAAWFLKKLTYDSTGLVDSILFGSGNTNFDKVWDNRSGIYESYA